MIANKLSKSIGNIGESYVEEAITYTSSKKSKAWIKWGAIAACITLMALSAAIVLPMMLDDSDIPPIDLTEPTELSDQAGGVNGKVNVIDNLTIIGEKYAISDEEAVEYLNNVKGSIINDLRASGVGFSCLDIKENGYSHIRTGDDGNSMAVNWRDYLAYDGDKLVAIIQVTKEESGIKHFLLFGGTWFSRYEELLREYKGIELVYLYIGDVEAFVTPENEVVPLMDTDVYHTLELNMKYYEFFKTEYNVYIP